MEKVTILGSSNAVAKAGQQNTHLLFETETRRIMVDCGNHPVGSLTRIGISINQITDMVLTHFHADHVGSLPLLIMDMWLEKRIEPLAIYGLDTTLQKAQQLLDLFDWHKWKGMFPVSFNPLNERINSPEVILQDRTVKMSVLPVMHLIPTIGVLVEFASGKRITYSCDTEPCGAVETLAEKADILLQEAAGYGKGHTSPEQAGEIATRCMVNRLVLIHYDSRSGEKELLTAARSTFGGKVDLAVDGMVL